MQRTTNYGLCQYEGSDKTSYLVNYNDDMLKIDTAIKAASDDAASAQAKADTADGKADTNAQNISALNTQINGEGGVAADVLTLQGNLNTINSLIGNGEPTTTDKTLIGAINELDSSLKTKKFNHFISENTLASVTSDGTETRATMLNKLYAAASTALAGLDDNIFITGIATLVITGDNKRPSTPIVLLNKNSTLPEMSFSDASTDASTGSIIHEVYSMRSSNSHQSNSVLRSGDTITFYQNDSEIVASDVTYAIEVQFYIASDSIR